jgi:hypothetical protein
MDAELARQRGMGGALLDISADARRGGGIGVQPQLHQRALPRVGAHRGARASPAPSPRWVFPQWVFPNGFSRDAEIYDDARPRTAAPASIARRRRPHHRAFPAAIPWRVAPQQSPLPLRCRTSLRPPSIAAQSTPVSSLLLTYGVHQPLAQPADSLPQLRPIAPILRDNTRKPGSIVLPHEPVIVGKPCDCLRSSRRRGHGSRLSPRKASELA